MSANFSQSIKNVLTNQNVRNFYAWSESTVVLHWLKDKGEYKVFVGNRVAKIREHNYLEWNYVPTRNNSADSGVEAVSQESFVNFGGMDLSGQEIVRTGQNSILLAIMNLRQREKKVKELLANIVDLQIPIDNY